MKKLLLLLLLALPAAAQPVTSFSLVGLLSTLQSRYPGAEVTGRFSDWRTLSKYRSHAGLHYGYDIALPYGSEVPAAWPGRVVAVTPWFGPQYGITVESNGVEVTYGHLEPLVRVGQSIEPGQAVGRTVIDHVDVKMRDAAGHYVDFGQASVSPERMLKLSYEQALSQANQACQDLEQATEALQRLQREARGGSPRANDWGRLYAEGAISRQEFEKAERRQKEAASWPERLRRAEARAADSRKAWKQSSELCQQLAAQLPESQRKALAAPVRSLAAGPTTIRPDLQKLLEEGVVSREEAVRLSRVR